MPDEPKRIKEIFLTAAEKPTRQERDAHVREACAGDDGLRQKVEALLRRHDEAEADSFLSRPALELFAPEEPETEFRQQSADDEPESPEPARTVGGYVLGPLLGKGGEAEVYQCWKPDAPHVKLALKVLQPRATGREKRNFLARFALVAQAQARVNHPAVCKIIKCSIDEDPPYLVMPLYSRTLDAELKRRRGFYQDPREAVRLVARLAEGLDALHQTKIVHRDVKPSNVLLDEAGQPVLSDLGLVRLMDTPFSLTEPGAIVCTPLYSSPEQIRSDLRDADGKVSPATDVYSLGGLLFQMITGLTPVDRKADLNAVVAHHAQPTTPRHPAFPAGVDRRLAKIIDRAMAYYPKDRPSARQLAADLRRWLNQGATGPVWAGWLAAGVACAALVVLAFWGLRTLPRSHDAADERGPVVADEQIIPDAPTQARPAAVFVGEEYVFRAIRDHLKQVAAADRPAQRYFSLALVRDDRIAMSAGQVARCRKVLGQVVGCLGRGQANAVLRPAGDPYGVVYAVDLRELGWEEDGFWAKVKERYPYDLDYAEHPDTGLQDVARQVRELAGEDLLCLRADWFLAAAPELAPEKAAKLRELLEPADPIVERYAQNLDLHAVSRELDYADPDELRTALRETPGLPKELTGLAAGGVISRKQWAAPDDEDEYPLFKKAARQLNRGIPRSH